MLSIVAGLALLAAQDGHASNPYTLGLGQATKHIALSPGVWDMKKGSKTSVEAIAQAAKGYRYVLVGESHDQLAHHEFQAQVIEALVKSGRDVVVGMEMFTRDNQRNVIPWSSGRWDKETFIRESNWKTQWGFDYDLYSPIFKVVKGFKLPLYALNVPRDWVREVGREGPSKIDASRKPWVPELYLQNENHREIFTSLMGGHPMTGPQGENIYAAQVTWDTGMAKSAIDAMEDKLSDNWVMVIVAGIGHVMYGECINYRIKRMGGGESLDVVCIDKSNSANLVSTKIADFVYYTGFERPDE